jgi:hypothetical protein
MRSSVSRRSSAIAILAHPAIALVLGLLMHSARADLFYFEKGGQVQASAVVEGSRVAIELPGETIEFRREDFRKLVPGFSPDRELSSRQKLARSAGCQVRYDAIWWAIENGLAHLTTPEIRALHTAEPNHAPTARMVAALDKLDHPCADPASSAFRKALGISTSVTRGPHVLLLHQQTEAEAGERVALLERVMTSYYLILAAQGIELRVPDRRLIFAWFADQKDYVTFLRSQQAEVFLTTRGYYHPTWNAVVTYDARSTESQQKERETARARRQELEQFRATIDRIPARARLRVTLTGESARTLGRVEALAMSQRLEREVRREELLLDLQRRAIDEGTAAHEMIHLLAASSGLVPHHGAFPVWLQEGFAMQFEGIRGGRWAGIGRASDLRLPDWRRISPPPSLERLIRDIGFGRGYQGDLYAQAWSLVYFLRSQRSAHFLRFIDLLRSPDASVAELAPADRYMTLFQRAFGSDLDVLERDWHEFMAVVQTPLERHEPEARVPPRTRIRN